MKKIILLSVLAAMSFSVFGARDITPARYNFSAMPVGPLTIDRVLQKPKINASEFPACLTDGGVISLVQFNFSKADHADIEKIKSGLSIVDLGGTAGKVLCFKGSKSTFAPATAQASGDLTVPNFNLAFYLNPEITPTTRAVSIEGGIADGTSLGHEYNNFRLGAIIRTTFVFKIVDNTIDAIGDQPTFTPRTVFGNGVAVNNKNNKPIMPFSTYSFATITEDPETLLPTAKYNENDWLEVTMDHYVNEKGGLPFWAELFIYNSADGKLKMDDKALLIKSVKMTTGYKLGDADFYKSIETACVDQNGIDLSADGKGFTAQNSAATLPIKYKKVQYTSAPSAINSNELNDAACLVSGNEVNIINIPEGESVAVYSVNGVQVAQINAAQSTETLTLAQGYYIVRVGKKALKVAIY